MCLLGLRGLCAALLRVEAAEGLEPVDVVLMLELPIPGARKALGDGAIRRSQCVCSGGLGLAGRQTALVWRRIDWRGGWM